MSAFRLAPRRRQHGGTALGFLLGVVAGLMVAAGVAIVATRAPLPLVNKNQHVNASPVAPAPGQMPDPNRPLYREEQAAQAKASVDPAASANPDAAPIIAAVPSNAPTATTTYLLQAGAFRAQSEADGMRARLALIGFEAGVETARIDNETIYRVRLGPYGALDTMNLARAKLADNGIEASVVRQQ